METLLSEGASIFFLIAHILEKWDLEISESKNF